MPDKIDKLIVNSPYEAPQKRWQYDRERRQFNLLAGRRDAGYVVATPNAKGFDDPGQFKPIKAVNTIRTKVDVWREARYAGATIITRKLLEHWQDNQERENRFFFCQLEAIETLIWLVETQEGADMREGLNGDGSEFERLCSKMATGTGKTIVMAMIIAWNFLNKVTDPKDSRFGKHALIVAPGLTIKERLQVLNPSHEHNYYEAFNIVPPPMMERLRRGKLRIHNWHALAWDSQDKLNAKAAKGQLRSVDKRKRKAISDTVYVRQVLGKYAPDDGDLLVINDEAHHAWRVNPKAKGKNKRLGSDKDSAEEATVWIDGLDRIHRHRGILRCFDLSATPFRPSGDRSDEDSLFEWVVSDFGLNDAIESGLVKTPRVVTRDDSVLNKDDQSRLYHLYQEPEVKEDLNRKADKTEPLPDLVRNAYQLLGSDWSEKFEQWQEAGSKVPPVMITVANSIETAARIHNAFERQDMMVNEQLCNPDRLLQVDSKTMKDAEGRDERPEINGPGNNHKTLTKDKQAEYLRRKVGTVGQLGEPGEQLCNVISVNMLSEGWDAKNVTHIMGLRAFSSQLLCEQVVGRGLRRVSYDVEENGMFRSEYVRVVGVPFTFLPHEGGEEPPPEKPATRIESLPERAEHAIRWPNVARIDYEYKPSLELDWERIKPLNIDPLKTITEADMEVILAGKPHDAVRDAIDMEHIAENTRLQTVIFKIARSIYEQRKYESWKGSAYSFLSQLIPLAEHFIRSEYLSFKGNVGSDESRRKMLLMLHTREVIDHIWGYIKDASTYDNPTVVVNQERPIFSTGDMRPWYTRKPCQSAAKSHISHCVYDSRWEASEAYKLDKSDYVESFVKNDHLGFVINYSYGGATRKYYPDFLIRLTNGDYLVLEVKGQDSGQEQEKRKQLGEWCKAVTNHGGFGCWHCAVSFSPSDLSDILAEYGEGRIAA